MNENTKCNSGEIRKDNIEKGLEEGSAEGNLYAQKALFDFCDANLMTLISDEKYDIMLEEFCRLVEDGNPTATQFFAKLCTGNDVQLSHLSYRIAIGRYNINLNYHNFRYPSKSNGKSSAPIMMLRKEWYSLLIVNPDAFPKGEIMLSFTSDINVTPICVVGSRLYGRATYQSSKFGWLEENKQTVTLLKVGRDEDVSKRTTSEAGHVGFLQLIQKFNMVERDLTHYGIENIPYMIRETGSDILLIDPGEKEYSAEICHINKDKAQVIYRYTVDGYDQGEQELANVKEFHIISFSSSV